MSVDAFGIDPRELRAAQQANAAAAARNMPSNVGPVQGPTVPGQTLGPSVPGVTPGVQGPFIPPVDTGTTPPTPPTEPVQPPVTTPVGLTTEEVDQRIKDALDRQQEIFNQRLEDMLSKQQEQFESQRQQQLQADRRSAFEIMKERFASMGLAELGTEIENIYKGTGVDRFGKAITEIPTSESAFYLQLLNTKSYYDRFGKVNEDRVKSGYKALDEKTILGLEDQYQNVIKAYGLPAGFYDKPEDFQVFLRNDKSADEVAGDLQAYRDFVDAQKAAKPEIFNALKSYYGVDEGTLTAYFAEPEKGQKILEQVVGKNKNTAAALIAGLTSTAAEQATAYGAGNLTYQQQRQKYSQVAQDLSTTGRLAEIYGMNYGQQEALAAEFGSEAAALQAQRRVQQTAQAQFAGSSGVGRGALGRRTGGTI